MHPQLMKITVLGDLPHHPCFVPRSETDPYPRQLGLGRMAFPIMDTRVYLSPYAMTVLLDELEDNVEAMKPQTLKDVHLRMLERWGPYTWSEVQAASWFFGRQITQFYHHVDVPSGKLIGPDIPFSGDSWLKILSCPGKGRAVRYHRWKYNPLLIGHQLQLTVDETIDAHARSLHGHSN